MGILGDSARKINLLICCGVFIWLMDMLPSAEFVGKISFRFISRWMFFESDGFYVFVSEGVGWFLQFWPLSHCGAKLPQGFDCNADYGKLNGHAMFLRR